MKVETIVSGMLQNNTFLLTDEKSGESAVIDPAAHNRKLFDRLAQMEGLKLKYIIATHGHFDHVTDIAKLKETYGGMVVIHREDEHLFTDRRVLGSGTPLSADLLLEGGEKLTLGDEELTVYHTPGHTRGGICILCGKYLFTGDTLFHDDVGRTDLPGGSEAELRNSIKNVLGAIPGNPEVLPGHEEFSTLDYEKRNNPFFR